MPQEYGGLELSSRPWAAWQLFKMLGSADLAMSRAFETHSDMLELIAHAGSPDLQRRMFTAAMEDGAVFASWTSEPVSVSDDAEPDYGVEARAVEGGYLLNGAKGFCSGAGGVTYAMVPTQLDAPSAAGSAPTLVVDVRQDGVAIEQEWWQPLGMIASVSHSVRFTDVFVPRENVLCEGAWFRRVPWLLPKVWAQMGCAFLGAAEAGYRFCVDYVTAKGLATDALVQNHITEMTLAIQSAELWAEYAAGLWEDPAVWDDLAKRDAALDAARRTRLLAIIAAQSVLQHVPVAAGARSMFRQHGFERIYRDLSIYILQTPADRFRLGIGQRELGVGADTPTGAADVRRSVSGT